MPHTHDRRSSPCRRRRPSSAQRPSLPCSTSFAMTTSTKRSRFRTVSRRDWRAASSPPTCARPNGSVQRTAATAESPTSTSVHRAQRSAAPSEARRQRAVAARAVATRGRATCDAPPTRSTTATTSRSRRASSSSETGVPTSLTGVERRRTKLADMAERVEFASNGDSANGHLFTPESGSGGGVLVIQEWWGVDPSLLQNAERLSKAGFVALVPDLYHGELANHDEMDKAAHLMSSM